jgi:uncharacterized repeat protein (TIGR01451 family)
MFKPLSTPISLKGLPWAHRVTGGKIRWHQTIVQGLLITSPLWGLIRPVVAAPTSPGTIDNRATGSFIDTATDNPVEIFSNTVTVTVVEVAGITIVAQTPIEATPAQAGTNAGTYQSIVGIHTGDLVYFDFVLTNVGNDPTAFFIPAAPASVTGGTFNSTNVPLQIIAVDPDGTGTGYSPITNLNGSNGPFNVTTAGTTTTLLGATTGYIPPDGTVTLRVPIRITETTVGNTIAVVLGQTPTVGDQNITYVAGTNDVYTADLADTATNPYTSPATTPETPGVPVGGEKEASAQSTVALADPNVDFGDAPDTTTGTGANDYQTTIGDALSTTDDGALHSINTNLKMGTNAPDADNGILQNTTANADDTSGTDDEDGVTLPSLFTNVSSYTATVNLTNTIGSGAYLVGWIDFDRDGNFEPSEGIAYDSDGNAGNGITPIPSPTTNSNVNLTWTGLSGLTAGTTYARFRLSNSASLTPLTPTGSGSSGEVEDYALTIQSALDYGDAPDTAAGTASGNYRTTSSDGGASQALSATLRLGTQADGDTGLLQNTNADADDTNNLDDEDGVTTPIVFTQQSNSVYVVPVAVTNSSGSNAFLAGFIDLNQDGDFLDTNERSSSVLTIPNSTTNPTTFYLTFNNTGVNAATLGTTYTRFRLSSVNSDVTSAIGSSTNPGEVEDYTATIATAPSAGTPPTCPSVSTKLQWGTINTADNYYLYNTVTGTSSTGTLSGSNPQTAIFTDIAGSLDLRMSFAGNTALLTNQGTLGGAIATSTGLFSGGFSPAQPSLNLNISGARDDFATTSIEFIDAANGNTPVAVDSISFSIFDVDRNSTSWQDRVAVRGYNGASLVLPNLTIVPSGGGGHRFYNGSVNDVIATVGTTTNTGAGSGDGNVGVLFTSPITRFEIDYYNGYQANTPSGAHAIGLIGSIDFCSADFGDAPDTYGTDLTAANNGTDPVGASHTYNKRLKIGNTLPDLEANASTPYDATGDDVKGVDDEDTVTLSGLTTTTTTYSLNVPVTNTTGGSATLLGWIDFDRDGIFQSDEGATIAVPTGTNNANVTLTWNNIGTTGPNIVAGASYARLRLTTEALTTSNAGGAFADGEVQDHTLTIVNPVSTTPNLLLVKRITRLIRGETGAEIDYSSTFVNDGVANSQDDNAKWPANYLAGVLQVNDARPGDTVEYTIYFLNAGTAPANNVRICDPLSKYLDYIPNTYTGETPTDGGLPFDLGLRLTLGNSTPSTVYLTQENDTPDRGQFVSPGVDLTGTCITVTNNNGTPLDSSDDTTGDLTGGRNTNGVAIVNVTGNAAGQPTQVDQVTDPTGADDDDALGFIRFRARVK